MARSEALSNPATHPEHLKLLEDWLKSYRPEELFDAQGRLKKLAQSGWDIQFLEYTQYGSFDLPSKLYITRQGGRVEGNPAGDEAIEVRLSIERWTFE